MTGGNVLGEAPGVKAQVSCNILLRGHQQPGAEVPRPRARRLPEADRVRLRAEERSFISQYRSYFMFIESSGVMRHTYI